MNRIKLYLRQAWTTIRQNKLFSGIYIAGTGLSIALTITLFIIIYVKIAPIYPEYNRDRILSIKKVEKTTKDTTSSNYWSSFVSYEVVKMLRELPNIDVVTGISGGNWGHTNGYEASTEHNTVLATPIYTDADYWKVYSFEFIGGKPFNDADVTSSSRIAVVSQSFAKTLFMTDDVVGKTFDFLGTTYKIKGIVKDVAASMTKNTAADLWIPHTCSDEIKNYDNEDGLLGIFIISLTAKSVNDIATVKHEIADMMHRYNQQDDYYNHTINPVSTIESELLFTDLKINDNNLIIKTYLYILFALLLIPALNLSGMISSRMHKRLAELGIRKAYGATNTQLLTQILWENLLLTLCGGLVGLILSYIIVISANDWIINILNLGFNIKTNLLAGNLSIEMLFNWWVFLVAILVCFILNLISAIIPAIMALRKTIIYSLNSKK